MKYVFFLTMMVVSVVLAAMVVNKVRHGLTPEQIVQRHVADVSASPYIEEREDSVAEILAVLEDVPNSQLVRVVVRRLADRQILGVLSTKATPLTVGQH